MTWEQFSVQHPEAGADWLAHWSDQVQPRCVFGMLGDDTYLATSVVDHRQWRRERGRVAWTEVES